MSGRTSSSSGEPTAVERLRSLTRRPSLSDRVGRLRRFAWHLAQCAVAASLAYLLAQNALDHPEPFFAPVAAIVSLGLGYGQRLRRVAEVTAGVALGVLIGDLFAHLFGPGAWQILVVVLLSMGLAVLLEAGPLLVTQAGVQSAIITTLAPTAQAGFGRWLDAVCGGLVALAVAAVVPGSALRRPREAAAGVLSDLSTWLHDARTAVRTRDVDLAYRTLERARDSDALLADVRQAAADGLSVARSSPWRRRHRGDLLTVAELVDPMDRAVRNARVLLRRVTVIVRRGERVAEGTLDLLDRLADVASLMADDLRLHGSAQHARQRLVQVAELSSQVPVGESLSADVLLAQVRSVVVDLLVLSGIDERDAAGLVPRPADPERSEGGSGAVPT